MFLAIKCKRTTVAFKVSLALTLTAFLLSNFISYLPALGANTPALALPYLPQVGSLVENSPHLDPVSLRGLEFYPHNPFKFDFVLDQASADIHDDELQKTADRLLKYFFAALTMPAKDFWVNLSPYEQNVIVPDQLGLTDLGHDLLGEDYMLKQLSASLTCPNTLLGKKFWDKVYQQIQQRYGNLNIPANTFNKVWIMPDKCKVVEDNNCGFIKESRLKVMLEEDYIATQHSVTTMSVDTAKNEQTKDTRKISLDAMREVILPVIEEEINHGKNFLYLRQIYNSLILATWFKRKLKDSILNQTYADKKKIAGVESNDPQIKEKVYNQYLESYKQGAYNFIKKEFIKTSGGLPVKITRRKYFSGGFTGQNLPGKLEDQLETRAGSYLSNITSLKDPAILEAGAKPSFKPAARAPALITALLGLVILIGGCATSPIKPYNPILPKNTTLAALQQKMRIEPGMYKLGKFDKNRPTVIFTHGAGGNPYEFKNFISQYQNKYNIVVFTYKYSNPIQDSADFLTESYKKLIQTEQPGKVIFINHSYGNNVFAMAVKNDSKKIFAHDLVIQLTPTLAGSEKALGGSSITAKVFTSLFAVVPGIPYFGDISAAQDPEGETIHRLLSAPLKNEVLRIVMTGDPHGANINSPKTFQSNYRRYVLQDAVVLPHKTEDPHDEVFGRQDVIDAVDDAISAFAKGSKSLKQDFESHFKDSIVTEKVTNTTSLIGKRGEAKDITISPDRQSGTADVYATDTGNKLGQIQLQAAASPLTRAAQKIETMGTIQDKQAAKIILNILSQLQKGDNPDFFTFSDRFADVFGFAAARRSTKAIALHKALADNPIAVAHEAGEYLVGQEALKFNLANNILEVTLNETMTSFTLEGEALAIAQKGIKSDGTYNPHYGLRALQRLAFGQSDRDLTATIQNMQEANTKNETTPTRGGIDINLDKKMAVETSSKSLSTASDTAVALDPNIVLGVKPLVIGIYRSNKHT